MNIKRENSVAEMTETFTQANNGKTLLTLEEFFESFDGQLDFRIQNHIADTAKDRPLNCEDGLYQIADLTEAFLDASEVIDEEDA